MKKHEYISRDEVNIVLAGSGEIGEFIKYFGKIPSEIPEGYNFKRVGEDQVHLVTIIDNEEQTVFTFSNCYLLVQVNTLDSKILKGMKWQKVMQWLIVILIAIMVILQIIVNVIWRA